MCQDKYTKLKLKPKHKKARSSSIAIFVFIYRFCNGIVLITVTLPTRAAALVRSPTLTPAAPRTYSAWVIIKGLTSPASKQSPKHKQERSFILCWNLSGYMTVVYILFTFVLWQMRFWRYELWSVCRDKSLHCFWKWKLQSHTQVAFKHLANRKAVLVSGCCRQGERRTWNDSRCSNT